MSAVADQVPRVVHEVSGVGDEVSADAHAVPDDAVADAMSDGEHAVPAVADAMPDGRDVLPAG